MVEGACLENRCTATYRGFESLTHRINASNCWRFAVREGFALRAIPIDPPAPPGDGGKDSPASLPRAPFGRPSASKTLLLSVTEGKGRTQCGLIPPSRHAPNGASALLASKSSAASVKEFGSQFLSWLFGAGFQRNLRTAIPAGRALCPSSPKQVSKILEQVWTNNVLY